MHQANCWLWWNLGSNVKCKNGHWPSINDHNQLLNHGWGTCWLFAWLGQLVSWFGLMTVHNGGYGIERTIINQWWSIIANQCFRTNHTMKQRICEERPILIVNTSFQKVLPKNQFYVYSGMGVGQYPANLVIPQITKLIFVGVFIYPLFFVDIDL